MYKRLEWCAHREKAVNLWEQMEAVFAEYEVGSEAVEKRIIERFHREIKEINDRHFVERHNLTRYMLSIQEEAYGIMEKAFNIRSTPYERVILLRKRESFLTLDSIVMENLMDTFNWL